GYAIVFLPVRILGPGVESELRYCQLIALFYEHRAEVASPPSIGRKSKELDSRRINTRSRKHSSSACLVFFRIDNDSNEFSGRELANDFAVDPRYDRELAGPVSTIVRPADPRRFVRLPLEATWIG